MVVDLQLHLKRKISIVNSIYFNVCKLRFLITVIAVIVVYLVNVGVLSVHVVDLHLLLLLDC